MDTEVIFEENRKATKRLTALAQTLTNEQLVKVLNNNWPVYVAFAHIAFWDQRVKQVIELSMQNKKLNIPQLDMRLNELLEPFLKELAPQTAVELAIKTANILDDVLEECPQDILNESIAFNNRFAERHLHRNHHMDVIENCLSGKK
jgi:hypothetical protein